MLVSPRIARRRCIRAIALVAALVVAVPGIEEIARLPGLTQATAMSNIGLNSAYLTESHDTEVALSRLEDAAAAGGADIPEAFSQEIGFLPEARDIRANGDGSVVGYIVPFESAEAFDRLIRHMSDRGWIAASLGNLEGATFMKQEGSCRWTLATCTQVGSGTSVVMRSVIA